jgi:flagellar biogenesis protein FliO
MSKRVPSPHKASSPSFIRQVVESLLAALLIVILTVLVVTAKLGPGLDAREQREIQDQREERLEAAADEPPGVGTGATIG